MMTIGGAAGMAERQGGAGSQASASERIVEAVIDAIRTSSMVPGQRLSEPDLARRWNASRSSVREALKQLEAAGMITLNRFRGAYVSELDRAAVLNLLDVIEALVKLAARSAAGRCTRSADRARLREAARLIVEAAEGDDSHLFLDRRRDFYATLIDIGGNDELARAIPLSRTHLFRARLEQSQGPAQRADRAADYSRIAEAVVAGDHELAEQAVAVHIERTRAMVRGYRDELFI